MRNEYRIRVRDSLRAMARALVRVREVSFILYQYCTVSGSFTHGYGTKITVSVSLRVWVMILFCITIGCSLYITQFASTFRIPHTPC